MRGWSSREGRKVICRFFVDLSVGGLCDSPGLFTTTGITLRLYVVVLNILRYVANEDIRPWIRRNHAFDVLNVNADNE